MASYKDILRYYRGYWPIATLSIAAASLFEILDLLVPYAIGQILNVLSRQPLDGPVQRIVVSIGELFNIPVGQSLALWVLLGAIFAVSVLRAPIQPWIGSWFHWAIPLRARRDYAERVLSKILTFPLAFYDENNPGRIAGRVSRGLENHTWTYPEVAGQFVPKLARVLGIFGVILLIEWRIAIAFLLSFIVILGFSLRNLQSLIRREEIIDRYIENTESRTSEIITNIKTVKAFATEASELERQRQRFKREQDVILHRIHRGYVNLATWQRTVVQTSVFCVLAMTLIAAVQGRISIGHFITTLTVSSMAYAEIEPLSMVAEFVARRYAAMVRFHELIQEPSDIYNVDLSIIGETPPYQFTGKVDFRNISFGYDTDKPVLKDVSFLVEPYQTVALVGRSGSGKSTLVKLLFRYFDPTAGQILMDDQDIRSLDMTQYRKRLAIVHQEVDVFNGTLLDNLTYGNSQASFEQVQDACRIARVDEFIPSLANGYSTVVGERGVRLSGGQRQRLGIARALLVEPDVLVFDEATSSLDYESEREIQMAMRSLFGTRSLLVIAHRLSTVRDADKIVVLDQGMVAEVGRHEELLQNRGLYWQLNQLHEAGEILD
ncbi:Heterocyst differentiation ATP-binding protein HepA [Acaryochloris thomasi RCC1774]|uniref:Heterocyst differentiation ATP-binding protein HepA n=1 Tax=Acaryochloris thomasi RCC1774 TaxID=1764569 RepID=A0A2W1JZ05_9CYAN|nr:ABC transporter ATP-binding protein [Acaryochloris thomasi]PZD73721.1 Heterocyst differentiation ATP-binding protein HepA [Acaryochloris thomasi RCC1774]